MATNYGGYMGKVMLIDLSTGQIQEYPWSDRERRLFLGGKTMAAKILGDCLSPDVTPLSEENMLVISTGPFTGSGAPSSSRFNISTLSPLTGILTSSNCGGNFGYYLKKAGLDALIIRGKSPSPIWLEIQNETFTLHDAGDLWGTMTGEAQTLLDAKLQETTGNGKPVKNGKIVFVIAHRLSTVVDSDKILVMQDGKITGCGAHQELLSSHEFYNNLVNQQFVENKESV